MKSTLIVIFFFYSFNLLAQSLALNGIVYDAKTKMPIEYASARLLNAVDSSFINGVATDAKGHFRINTKMGNFILEASYIGYKKYRKSVHLSKDSLHQDLKIYLLENTELLSETVITANPPSTVVKGDTVEFNASSFHPDVSDVLEDLLKKVDGIDLDANGNVSANGKPITKILLNGKEFFGTDVSMALKNLPADMINKIQLYKEESDKEKLTGIKDANEDQVLNLTVKKEIKHSIFGNAEAGYGTSDRYATRINANYMRDENQFSGVINMRNTGGGQSSGLQDKKNAGFNFNVKKSTNFEIGGNFNLRRNSNEVESKSNSQKFLPTGNRTNDNASVSESLTKSINGGFKMKWLPDTLTTVYLRTSGGYNENTNTSMFNSSTFVESMNDTTTSNGNNNSFSHGNNWNTNLTVGRKLNNTGRNITLEVNGSTNDNANVGKNYSITHYSLNGEIKEIDQTLDGVSHVSNWQSSLSYIEPLSKTDVLQLSYSFRQNNSENNQERLKKDAQGDYTVIDTAYTRNTINAYITQNMNISFQSTKEKYNYTIGLNLIPSSSQSQVYMRDSLISKTKQRVINFAPSLRFTYKPNQTTNFDFNYSGSTIQANLNQLSADTITTSAMSKTYGNPYLKPSFQNSLNMRYQRSNYEKKTFLTLVANLNYTFDGITDYTLVDNLGNTTRTFQNVNGNMNSSLRFNYRMPIKKVTMGTNTNLRYSKDKGFSNGDPSTTNSFTMSEGVNANFSSETVDFYAQTAVSHTITKNNLSSIKDMAVTNYTIRGHVKWKLPLNFVVTSDLNYAYNTGYSSSFNQSSILWNASFEKRFFSRKQGIVKLYFYNILNGLNNVSRSESGSSVSYSWTNSINRYCMLSFIYKLKVFGGK